LQILISQIAIPTNGKLLQMFALNRITCYSLKYYTNLISLYYIIVILFKRIFRDAAVHCSLQRGNYNLIMLLYPCGFVDTRACRITTIIIIITILIITIISFFVKIFQLEIIIMIIISTINELGRLKIMCSAPVA